MSSPNACDHCKMVLTPFPGMSGIVFLFSHPALDPNLRLCADCLVRALAATQTNPTIEVLSGTVAARVSE